MAVSGNSTALKSFQSFAINEGLLAKIVEAVKAGEKQARTSGDIKSFEVFYRGFRQNISIGRIYIVPSKVCDVHNTFPIALLFGTAVKTFNLGEEVADLITNKIGDTEFDEYSQADYATIKEKLFTGDDGNTTSLIIFAPNWMNIREYTGFKYVDDDEKLSNLLRHLVFSAYFNPAVSSAFDALMTTVDTYKLDITDITPKMTYPFLGENPLKDQPDLSKQGSWTKPKIFLTNKTAEAIIKEVLNPQELDVFEVLNEALSGVIMPNTIEINEVVDFKTPDNIDKSSTQPPSVDVLLTASKTASDGNFGVVNSYEEANRFYPERADWRSLPVMKCPCGQKFRQEVRNQKRCRDCFASSHLGEGFYDRDGHKVGSAVTDGTEVRHRPDYGEKGSYTQEMNEENAKAARAKMGARFDYNATVCEDCGEPLNAWGVCPNTSSKDIKMNQQFCGKGKHVPNLWLGGMSGGNTNSDVSKNDTNPRRYSSTKKQADTANNLDNEKGGEDILPKTVTAADVVPAPFETPFTNVGPGVEAATHADESIAAKVDTISQRGDKKINSPIGIAIDETGVPRRPEEERKVKKGGVPHMHEDYSSKISKEDAAQKSLQLLDQFFDTEDMPLNLVEKALELLERTNASPEAAKELQDGLLEEDFDWAQDCFDKARGVLMTIVRSKVKDKADHVARAIAKELTHDYDAASLKTKNDRAKREAKLDKMSGWNRHKYADATFAENIWDNITYGGDSAYNTSTKPLPDTMTSDKPENAKAVTEKEIEKANPKSKEGSKYEGISSKTALLYMNDYDIEMALQLFADDPILGPATRFLAAFKEEVDSHSDGWAYWKEPVKAAAQLMALIQEAERDRREGNSPVVTEVLRIVQEPYKIEKLKKAIVPIKVFMNRRGFAAGMQLPKLAVKKNAVGVEQDVAEAKSGIDSSDRADKGILQPTKSVEEAAKVSAVGAQPVKVVNSEALNKEAKQYEGEHGCRTYVGETNTQGKTVGKGHVCMKPETVTIDGRMYCDEHRPDKKKKKGADVSGDISEAKSGVDSPDKVDADIKQPTKSVEEAAKVSAVGAQPVKVVNSEALNKEAKQYEGEHGCRTYVGETNTQGKTVENDSDMSELCKLYQLGTGLGRDPRALARAKELEARLSPAQREQVFNTAAKLPWRDDPKPGTQNRGKDAARSEAAKVAAEVDNPETLELAQRLIDSDDDIAYDVAANVGQIFDNVKNMKWFVNAVAEEIVGDEPTVREYLDNKDINETEESMDDQPEETEFDARFAHVTKVRKATWEDGKCNENCPLPERERCNTDDPNTCCGGGYDMPCPCKVCHPPLLDEDHPHAKFIKNRFEHVGSAENSHKGSVTAKKTATGEMTHVDPEEWPLHFAIAEALGGTVEPFDQYQGPYIAVGGDVRIGEGAYAMAPKIPGVVRLWIIGGDDGLAQVYNENNDRTSFAFSPNDTEAAIDAAREVSAKYAGSSPARLAAAGDDQDEAVEMSLGFGDLADLAVNLGNTNDDREDWTDSIPKGTDLPKDGTTIIEGTKSASMLKTAEALYTSRNFKTKKELKEAVDMGRKITVYDPGFGMGGETPPPDNGTCTVAGPHYPEPHRWYAIVTLKDGFIVKVK